jgi:hypothetical protein
MGLEITVDISGMEAMLSEENLLQAQMTMQQQIFDDTQQYVPVDTGALRDTAENDLVGGEITYNQKYANFVYNKDHVRTVKNPQASPAWFEKASGEHAGQWVDTAFDQIFHEV